MQQRKIILFIIVLFLISSAWLFWAGEKATDPNYNKNFWTLSFSDPKSNDLDFQIENHSDQTDFHWELIRDKDKIREGNIKIEKGALQRLSLNDVLQDDKRLDLGNVPEKTKFTVRVNAGGEEKEIYKNFDK